MANDTPPTLRRCPDLSDAEVAAARQMLKDGCDIRRLAAVLRVSVRVIQHIKSGWNRPHIRATLEDGSNG